MYRTYRIFLVLLACTVLGACGSDTPTDPSRLAPSTPARNVEPGGGWLGGGGKATPSDSTSNSTTNTGGGWLGGGGKVAPTDSTTTPPN